MSSLTSSPRPATPSPSAGDDQRDRAGARRQLKISNTSFSSDRQRGALDRHGRRLPVAGRAARLPSGVPGSHCTKRSPIRPSGWIAQRASARNGANRALDPHLDARPCSRGSGRRPRSRPTRAPATFTSWPGITPARRCRRSRRRGTRPARPRAAAPRPRAASPPPTRLRQRERAERGEQQPAAIASRRIGGRPPGRNHARRDATGWSCPARAPRPRPGSARPGRCGRRSRPLIGGTAAPAPRSAPAAASGTASSGRWRRSRRRSSSSR